MNLKSNKTQNFLIIFLSLSLIIVFSFKVIYTSALTNNFSELVTKPPILSNLNDSINGNSNNTSSTLNPLEIFPEEPHIKDNVEFTDDSNTNTHIFEQQYSFHG